MIGVFIGPDGNVIYRCSVCDETWIVSVRLSDSPFWEVFIGNALLIALGHYEDLHMKVNDQHNGE
jgi:hypothetical protein